MTLTHDESVIFSRFVGVDFKFSISFALNNDPEAQESCPAIIITAEMSFTDTALCTRDLGGP